MKKVKNNTQSAGVWVGQTIEAGDYYEIQAVELTRWQIDDAVLASISAGGLIMNDGDADLSGVNRQIEFLKDAQAREVVTQFEKRDKTLKLAHGESTVDSETGLARVLLQIPGTPGSADGRWISSGTAFFDTHHASDKILSVRFIDHSEILNVGADALVGSYTDDDAPEENQGWAIPPVGHIEAEAIGGYGFAPAGLWIEVVGKKSSGNYSGTLFVNFEWGKTE